MKKVKKMAIGGIGVKPAPFFAKPAPVVAKPAPVVAKPAPVVAKPAPVVAKPVPMPAGPMSKVQALANTFRGGPPAPTIPSTPSKPPVGYADDLAGVYAAAKNQPQIFGPQARMPAGGPIPMPAPTPASITAAKPASFNPNYMKKGGAVKAYAKGGKTSSASSRGDGIAQRGKTKGRMI